MRMRAFIAAKGTKMKNHHAGIEPKNEERHRREQLERLLFEGLEGEAIEADDAFWDEVFRRFDERQRIMCPIR